MEIFVLTLGETYVMDLILWKQQRKKQLYGLKKASLTIIAELTTLGCMNKKATST